MAWASSSSSCHFFVPFGALLSRSLKRNAAASWRASAIWILLIHYVDIYWLVMPTLYPDGVSRSTGRSRSPSSASAWSPIAFGVSRLRGRLPVPMRDPYLAESLRYRQP